MQILPIMKETDLEKLNFLSWYCRYAEPEEIEQAMKTNRPKLKRLIHKYAYEIERIEKIKNIKSKI